MVFDLENDNTRMFLACCTSASDNAGFPFYSSPDELWFGLLLILHSTRTCCPYVHGPKFWYKQISQEKWTGIIIYKSIRLLQSWFVWHELLNQFTLDRLYTGINLRCWIFNLYGPDTLWDVPLPAHNDSCSPMFTPWCSCVPHCLWEWPCVYSWPSEHQQMKHEWRLAWHLQFEMCPLGTFLFSIQLLCCVQATIWWGPHGEELRTLDITPSELPAISWHQLSAMWTRPFGNSHHPSVPAATQNFPISENLLRLYSNFNCIYSLT